MPSDHRSGGTDSQNGALNALFSAVEHAGDAAIAIDAHQRIVAWNAAAEALLGWRRDEALGRTCYEVLAGRDPSGNLVCHAWCAEMVMAHRGEPIRSRDLCYRTRAGRSAWVNVSTLVVTAPGTNGGRVTVHLIRDIGARRRVEQLVEAGLAAESVRHGPSPLDALTRREREILTLLARGVGTRTIASTLFISPITARNHVQNILRKFGAHSRAEAVAIGLRAGLTL